MILNVELLTIELPLHYLLSCNNYKWCCFIACEKLYHTKSCLNAIVQIRPKMAFIRAEIMDEMTLLQVTYGCRNIAMHVQCLIELYCKTSHR